MEFNLADLFEYAVDNFPEREYLVAGGQRRTYLEMEQRANRLAHFLANSGIKQGDHVGIYAYNCVEWIEALWAIFKIRAIWININYRYVENELAYLFENADLVALIHAKEFTPRINAVRSSLPLMHLSIVIDDVSSTGQDTTYSQDELTQELKLLGSLPYEEVINSQSPERDFPPRSPDDRYILYTGGTTGMPKGVIWRHEDVFYALGRGIDPITGQKAEKPQDMVERGRNGGITIFPIAPLMHGASQWGVMGSSFIGDKVILTAKFEPHNVWRTVQDEKANTILITGDAMARPLVEALDDPGVNYDLSSLFAISSSAAIFSSSLKEEFFSHFPNLIISDAVGSSEGGNNGIVVLSPGNTKMQGGPTITPLEGSIVIDEDFNLISPGSNTIGKIARTGHIPLGYLKDPVKTKETFLEFNGVRYVVPGDFAKVEEDGTITLLGRGSVSINSGGEKIFPEEVESAIKSHPDVYDVVVVGIPDERWGQRVACVIEPRPGKAPELDSIREHCRTLIAGYKLPREVHFVEVMQRSPSGKADYPWAKQLILERSREGQPSGR